jgi:tryptophan synthase alpha chain
MIASEHIGAAIRAAVATGRPALVGYLTAGFPSRRRFKENLAAVAAGCDVVEIGVPFSDPMADGATVQRASFAALADGVTLPWILDELQSIEPRHAAPILLMSYLNPLLAFGMEQLPRAAARAGVSGFIVPDLPFEESADLHQALEAEGLALVQMVTPVTPPERLKMLCREAKGFVYAVTMTGTTYRSRCSNTWIESNSSAVFRCAPASAFARPGKWHALRRTSTASWSARRWWRRWKKATMCAPS